MKAVLLILITSFLFHLGCGVKQEKQNTLTGCWLSNEYDILGKNDSVLSHKTEKNILRWEFGYSWLSKKTVLIDHNNSDTEEFEFNQKKDTIYIFRVHNKISKNQEDPEMFIIEKIDSLHLIIKSISKDKKRYYCKKVNMFY